MEVNSRQAPPGEAEGSHQADWAAAIGRLHTVQGDTDDVSTSDQASVSGLLRSETLMTQYCPGAPHAVGN
jgi:hypothetical protein